MKKCHAFALVLVSILLSNCRIVIDSNKAPELQAKPAKILVFVEGNVFYLGDRHTTAILTSFENELKEKLKNRGIQVQLEPFMPLSLHPVSHQAKVLGTQADWIMHISHQSPSLEVWNIETKVSKPGEERLIWRSALTHTTMGSMTPRQIRRCVDRIIDKLEEDGLI